MPSRVVGFVDPCTALSPQGCFVRAGGRDDQLTRTLEPGGVPNPKGMYMRTVSVSDGVYCEMDGLVITSGKVRVEEGRESE